MTKHIYLDYAASTPLDPHVFATMQAVMSDQELFANPHATHALGLKAKAVIDAARAQVAEILAAEPSEIIFTSGATESDNLAIKGAARLYKNRGNHIITSKTEHKAVLDVCQHLEKQGFFVTYLTPDANGVISIDDIHAALRPETILVSMMYVNNETGVQQNIAEIAQLTSAHNILFHVDAAQAIGRLVLNVQEIPVDLISLSAHKVYGPKGIGALYVRKRPRVRLEALLHGGGHELGMRSGTLATHQIAGMGEAMRHAMQKRESDRLHALKLRDLFVEKLKGIENFRLNAPLANTVPHILNFRLQGMMAAALMQKLPHIALSTSSACQAASLEGSYVLRVMGMSTEDIQSSIRASFGRFTTKDEILCAANDIRALFA